VLTHCQRLPDWIQKKLTHHPILEKIVYQLMQEVAQVSVVDHEELTTKGC